MSVCSSINAGSSMLFYYNIPLHVGQKGRKSYVEMKTKEKFYLL